MRLLCDWTSDVRRHMAAFLCTGPRKYIAATNCKFAEGIGAVYVSRIAFMGAIVLTSTPLELCRGLAESCKQDLSLELEP